MFPLNLKFLRLSYFEKIWGTGRTDERIDGVQRYVPLVGGRVITYTLPTIVGVISVTLRSKINKFFRKAHLRGLVTTVLKFNRQTRFPTIPFNNLSWSRSTLLAPPPQKKLNCSINLRPNDTIQTSSRKCLSMSIDVYLVMFVCSLLFWWSWLISSRIVV